MVGMSRIRQIVWSVRSLAQSLAMSLARSLRGLVAGRLLGRGLDRETARSLPGAMNVGVDAERHSHATTRWRDSGYDLRLAPYAWPDEATQRNYDLYDAWANRGYEDNSEFWPPRTLRGRLLQGRQPDGKPAVSREGWDGYSPDPMRLSVWGIDGALHDELAERGTLGTRKTAKMASPGDPLGGPI